MSEQEIKLKCLEMAIKNEPNPLNVMELAKKYWDFAINR